MPTELPIFEFAFPGPLRDKLVSAVLDGTKTTTTGLLHDYEIDGDPLPVVRYRAAQGSRWRRRTMSGIRNRQVFQRSAEQRRRLLLKDRCAFGSGLSSKGSHDVWTDLACTDSCSSGRARCGRRHTNGGECKNAAYPGVGIARQLRSDDLQRRTRSWKLHQDRR